MNAQLICHIPEAAIDQVRELLSDENLVVKIKKQRVSKHGDYKRLPSGKHQITVNNNLNNYRFLITLVHEIAHYEAFKNYGRKIKPHGKEWKYTFKRLMLPFIRPEIFPVDLLPLLARHFKNPKASSNTDEKLSLALKQFDPPSDKYYVFEIPMGSHFRAWNGKIYRRAKKRTKRYECVDISNNRIWLFNPNAEVDFVDTTGKIISKKQEVA